MVKKGKRGKVEVENPKNIWFIPLRTSRIRPSRLRPSAPLDR